MEMQRLNLYVWCAVATCLVSTPLDTCMPMSMIDGLPLRCVLEHRFLPLYYAQSTQPIRERQPVRFTLQVSHRRHCTYHCTRPWSHRIQRNWFIAGSAAAGHDRRSGSRVRLNIVKARRWGAQRLQSGCLVLVRQASGMDSPRPSMHHRSSRCSKYRPGVSL